MGTILANVQPIGGDLPVSIRFEGSCITAISKAPIAPVAGDDVVDGGGRLVATGFVNAHTHLAMVLFRGLADDVPLKTWLEEHIWPIEAKLSPEDVYWCTLLGLAEGIRGGTIAYADMYFHTDAVAQAVEESGARGLLSYGMIAPSMEEKGRAELDTAVRFVDRWDAGAGGRVRAAISPHSIYTVGEDVWRSAIEAATDRGVPIHRTSPKPAPKSRPGSTAPARERYPTWNESVRSLFRSSRRIACTWTARTSRSLPIATSPQRTVRRATRNWEAASPRSSRCATRASPSRSARTALRRTTAST